jgi:hypothetical protein
MCPLAPVTRISPALPAELVQLFSGIFRKPSTALNYVQGIEFPFKGNSCDGLCLPIGIAPPPASAWKFMSGAANRSAMFFFAQGWHSAPHCG